jgi:hypothetical protein
LNSRPHRGSDIFLHIPTIGNFENGFTEGMIFHTPTAHRVRLRSTVFFLRLFDRMGLNWLEQSRDPSSEKKQRQCKRDRTESKLKSCEVAGGKELSYGGNETTTNAEPDNFPFCVFVSFPKAPRRYQSFCVEATKEILRFPFRLFRLPFDIYPTTGFDFISFTRLFAR